MKEKCLYPLLRKKGFSLVEILVSMAILSIFIAAFAPFMAHSFHLIMWSGEKSSETYGVQRMMEERDLVVLPAVDNIHIQFDNGKTVMIESHNMLILTNADSSFTYRTSRTKFYQAACEWDGDDLTVTLTYTYELKDNLSGADTGGFALEYLTDGGGFQHAATMVKDKTYSNLLKVTFLDYKDTGAAGAYRVLTYTGGTAALEDASGQPLQDQSFSIRINSKPAP